MKRFTSLSVIIIMIASFLMPKGSYAETALTITATPIDKENYIHLEWTDLGREYLYTVYAKGQDEEVYQSIPSKTDLKVLNVYPNVGSELKI